MPDPTPWDLPKRYRTNCRECANAAARRLYAARKAAA